MRARRTCTGRESGREFGREVRRLSGAAPGELLLRSQDDDSYWLYRCWC